MEVFRKALRGWTVRALLSLLVLSFILWGVRADFGSFGSSTLVKVGGTSVTAEQYSRLFGDELRRYAMESGQNLSADEARRAGLDQRVFAKLKIDEHARQLGLGFGDQGVLERVIKSGQFNKADGSFDKDALRNQLQQLGLSEAGYFASQRQDAVRTQVIDAIGTPAPVPQTMLDAVNRFQAELRTLEYFTIPLDKVAAPAAPDDAKLKAFYEERKGEYMAPEYRKLALLVADPQKLKSTIKPTADEIKAAYEATKASFATPETRQIDQIVFPDLAAAKKAYDELKAGKDFLEVAKAAGKTAKDIDRGVVRKEDLLDKKAAEAAFGFGAQTFTAPVEGDLAISILRARDIKPATQKSLDEVKGIVEDRLKLDGAQKQLANLVTQVEDQRAAATPMQDIAKTLGLAFTEIAAIDRASKDPDGKVIAIAGDTLILPIAFGKDVGVESDAVSLGNAGYAWVDVLEVKPARQKTFDEVKAAVTESWTLNEKIKALTEMGRALVTRANAGEPLAKLAGELQLTVKTSPPFTRRNPGDVPGSAAKLAFALAKGAAGTTSTDDSKGRIVMRLLDVTAPKPLDKDQKDRLTAQLQRMFAADQQAQYLQSLDRQLGFTLDVAAFNRLAGAGVDDGSGS